MNRTLDINDIDYDLGKSASGYFVELSAVIDVKVGLLIEVSRD